MSNPSAHTIYNRCRTYSMPDIIFRVKRVCKALLGLELTHLQSLTVFQFYWKNDLKNSLLLALFKYPTTTSKDAWMQPVSYKDPKSILSNYRPVPLLLIDNNVMRSIINSYIVELDKLKHERYCRLHQERYTTDRLTSVAPSCSTSLKLACESQVIKLDVSNTFNRM